MGDTAQYRLKDAFDKRNLEEFSVCIALGEDPSSPYDDDLCIYYKVLSTYGCSRFAEQCLKSPHVHTTKLAERSIIFAAKSMDPKILEQLLPSEWLNEKWYDLTPLNYLAKNANNHNVDYVIDCVKLLLEHNAIPDIADVNGTTPLGQLLQNQNLDKRNKRRIVNHILKYDPVRNDALRSQLVSKFHNLRFSNDSPVLNSEGLSPVSEARVIDIFPMELSKDEKREKLLESIKNRHYDYFDSLLENGADYIGVGDSGDSALDYCIKCVNSYALEELLQKHDSKFVSTKSILLTLVMSFERNAKEKNVELPEFYECLDLLLLKYKYLDINEVDSEGKTILHYSCLYSDRSAMDLLQRGAFLGARDKNGIMAIKNINSKVLEEFFNGFISAEDGDQSRKISLDYKYLIPPRYEYDIHSDSASMDYDSDSALKVFITPKNLGSSHETKEYFERNQSASKILKTAAPKPLIAPCATQMEIIEGIANNDLSKYLLEHPLISIFLLFKWQQLSRLFYLNFGLYVFFAASCVTYIILKFSRLNSAWTTIFLCLSCLSIVCLILRESLQLTLAWHKYLHSFFNYMECLMIILAIIICSDLELDCQTQKVLSVFLILLITYELFQVMGSLPILAMSTRMHMFEVVCSNFLKHFVLFSIFVISFSLCFYLLIGTEVDGNTEDLNDFTSPAKAFLKATVMMTGELDADSLKLEGISYILFFLFLFIVTIVLYNLLNGTAIRDILEIEGQAKINEIGHRVKLICRYDQILNDHWYCITYIQKLKFRKRNVLRVLFPFYIDNISIFPEKFLGTRDRVARPDWRLKSTIAKTLGVGTDRKGNNEIPLDNATIQSVFNILNERNKGAVCQDHGVAADIKGRLDRIGERLADIEEYLEPIRNIANQLKAIRDAVDGINEKWENKINSCT